MARKLPLVEGFFFVDVVMLQTATILVVLSMADMDCLVRKLQITPQTEVPEVWSKFKLELFHLWHFAHCDFASDV